MQLAELQDQRSHGAGGLFGASAVNSVGTMGTPASNGAFVHHSASGASVVAWPAASAAPWPAATGAPGGVQPNIAGQQSAGAYMHAQQSVGAQTNAGGQFGPAAAGAQPNTGAQPGASAQAGFESQYGPAAGSQPGAGPQPGTVSQPGAGPQPGVGGHNFHGGPAAFHGSDFHRMLVNGIQNNNGAQQPADYIGTKSGILQVDGFTIDENGRIPVPDDAKPISPDLLVQIQHHNVPDVWLDWLRKYGLTTIQDVGSACPIEKVYQ